MPTFNTTVGLNGVLKKGQDQHFVGFIKNGAYTGNSCFVYNVSFAGLTTGVIVYAIIMIMR